MSTALERPVQGARTAVSPMLIRLVAERATGALLRDRGTLYLRDGQVVHAESPAAPGIDVLLTTAGRLRPEGWAEAVDRAGPLGRVARFLVESGQVGDGELELCHLGALHDAAFFALAPTSGPTRFRYGVAHWMGTVRPVPAAAVEREVARRRELLDRIWPTPDLDAAPLMRGRPSPDAPLTPRQRAVLARVDGRRTPQDIARELGRPAFHTLIDVRRLAAAGAVETPRTPAPTPDLGASWAARMAAETTTAPDVALLRRLRDALEATL
ncbi:transcriptional regulator [Streptomyces sp. NPDC048111]|uniref:transcriptional regulator n=1 Tax=Streptomyces sp. NPDC048111 TaxID=3365500 RepID=UPI003713BEA3